MQCFQNKTGRTHTQLPCSAFEKVPKNDNVQPEGFVLVPNVKINGGRKERQNTNLL